MQIAQVGGGPPEDIVMIHGLGANTGFWFVSAVDWFRRFGRVTLFDLPGHGESDMPSTGYRAPDLARVSGELLDHFGIESAHIVGHSFGGAVALAFAAQQPARTRSLVLADVRLWSVEPPTNGDEAGPWLKRARAAGFELADTRLDVSVQILVELARLRLATGDFGAAVSTILPGAQSLFAGRRAAAKWLRLIETTRAYEEMIDRRALTHADLAQIQQPMLALYAGLSGRKRSARALKRYCPGCRLRMVPDVGHFFPLTRPRLFARPALAFLRSITRRQLDGHRGQAPVGAAQPVHSSIRAAS